MRKDGARRTQSAKTSATSTFPRRRSEDRPVGPFAQLVLCAVKALPSKECYGARIEEFLSDQLGELVDLAQVYVTLKRLQGEHFIIGRESAAPGKNGHFVTNYTITPSGRTAVDRAATFYSVVHSAPSWGS